MKKAWMLVAALVAAAPLGAEAKVLLWEDFEAGALGARWTVFQHPQADVQVVDVGGNKVLQVAGSGVAVVGDPTWTDYTVEGDVFVYDGSYSAYAAGLVFRGSGDFSSSAASDTYVYEGRPGIMQLEKWVVGRGWTHDITDGTHPFQAGEWRRFKVVCRGGRFLFYLDGQLAGEHNDAAAHLAGLVGFRTWGAGAYFDNLLVTDEPADVALFEDFSAGVLDGRWLFQDQNGPGGSAATPAAFVPEIVTTPDGRRAMKLVNNGVAVIGDPAWTDYTVEADLFVFDAWYGAFADGLVFRATPPLGSWYGFDAYVLEGRPYQNQVEKWTAGADYSYPAASSAVNFSAGAWHHLKATVDGARVQVWIDGVPSGDFVDPAPHLTGAVGFRDYMLGAYYTDLKVTAKDVTVPTTVLTLDATPSATGWYTTWVISGTLAATDTQSPVREIWYGRGGMLEVPTAGDAIPVSFSDGVNAISFHAVDAFGNVEPQQVTTVRVDASVPWVDAAFPCALPGNAGWCRAAIPATLTATDNLSGVASLSWTVAGVASTSASPAAAFTVGDGRTTVTWTAADVATNVAPVGSAALLVDATAPSVSVTASPGTLKGNGALQPVKIGGSAKDATSGLASVALRVTDKNGVLVASPTYGSTIALRGTKGQVYTVTATGTDVAGNAKVATAKVKVQ